MILRRLLACLLVCALLTAPAARAATLLNTTNNPAPRPTAGAVPPIGCASQIDGYSAVETLPCLLDDDPFTVFTLSAWSPAVSDELADATFFFAGERVENVWLRSGNQRSYSDYWNDAAPTELCLRVIRSDRSSVELTYSIEDCWNPNESSDYWQRGYQRLAFPSAIPDAVAIELFVTRWRSGSNQRYAVTLSDIVFDNGSWAAYSRPSYEDTAAVGGYSAQLKQRLSTRSGPGTNYDELGTYFSAGETVQVLTAAWDDRNDIWWVQVEFTYRGEKRRAYTGLKRVDIDIDLLPRENLVGMAQLTQTVTPHWGPGTDYAVHGTQLEYSQCCQVCQLENGWAQLEYYDQSQYRRVWVPQSALRLY